MKNRIKWKAYIARLNSDLCQGPDQLHIYFTLPFVRLPSHIGAWDSWKTDGSCNNIKNWKEHFQCHHVVTEGFKELPICYEISPGMLNTFGDNAWNVMMKTFSKRCLKQCSFLLRFSSSEGTVLLLHVNYNVAWIGECTIKLFLFICGSFHF